MSPPGSDGRIRIVSAGDLMVDVLARLPGPLAVGSDTPAPISYVGGGAAANLAAWAAVAGATATFVGRVGADAIGRQAVTDLEAAGVEPLVVTDPDLPTGTIIVLIDPAAERTMIPSAGANESPLAPQLPAEADWLCMSGYPLLRPATRAWAVEALATARERGWSVAVDAASAAPLAEFGAAAFLELIGTDVLLLANEHEARVLTSSDDPTEAAAVLASRVGSAVVKRGAAGVVWSTGGADTVAVPAMTAEVVDTTGAGDAFAAGFLAASGAGVDALRAGLVLAARAVAQVGARPHLV